MCYGVTHRDCMYAPVEDTGETVENTATDEQSTSLRFYLVRHGQTYTNAKDVSIASAGSAPLTDKGRIDAFYAGMGIAEEGTEFLATYCSPLNRTRETAEYLLAGLGVDMPITVEPNVKDINRGVSEAFHPEEFVEHYGVDGEDFVYYMGLADDATFEVPVEGAESTCEFVQRFESGLQNIVAQHEGETGNILVAAHSTIGFYATKFTGEDPHGVPNTRRNPFGYFTADNTTKPSDNREWNRH